MAGRFAVDAVGSAPTVQMAMVIAKHQVAQTDPETVPRLLADIEALAEDDVARRLADDAPVSVSETEAPFTMPPVSPRTVARQNPVIIPPEVARSAPYHYDEVRRIPRNPGR